MNSLQKKRLVEGNGWLRGGWVAALAVCTAGWMVPAYAGSYDPAVSVSVVENTPERIVLHYQMGDFRTVPVTIAGREYARIALGTEGLMLVRGAPDLPQVCRSIIVPNDAEMAVRVLAADYHDVSNLAVAPSKGNLYRNQDPATVPFEFGEMYAVDGFWPGEPAVGGEPYILRDFRGMVVTLNPLQYNPVTQTLRVYTEVTVEVVPVGPGVVNVLTPRLRAGEMSLAFHQIYGSHFLNYAPDLRYAPLDEVGDMLIICYDAWLSNVQSLVNYKNSIGINTTAVGISTIGNNATSIKNYIQNRYNTSDLAFVLLVGDAAQVATPTASGGSSDPSYSKLAGGDNYPDIIVGRFSAETAAQVDTQVLRTVEYEQMPATTQAWFKRGTGIGSAEGPGDDNEYDYQHIANIRTDLLGYGYTVVDPIYDPGATAAQVSTALNAGRGVINYCGHGSTTSWVTSGFSNSNVSALLNDNLLPFIFSVACVNGQFDGYTCFAEAWLRSTRSGEPIGAIGAYMSSINQSWNPPMIAQDESNDLLAHVIVNNYFSFGALCFAGSCQMMDEQGAAGVEMFDTWHVFGDPSVRVFGTAQPPHGLKVTPGTSLTSTGPVGGPFTPNSLTYTLENLNATPLNYTVSKTQSWVSLSGTSGTLAGHATTTITVSINSLANLLANGNYSDTIGFVNTTDHDGDTTRAVVLQVGGPQVIQSFPLDSSPGWTIAGQWAFGHPTGQGGTSYGNPDPSNGYTGSNVYGVNLTGDYSTAIGGPYYLRTNALNCTGYRDVTLKFWRWLNSDYTPYVSVKIEASNNGTSWNLIWNNGTAEIADSSWQQFSYDISDYADNSSTVYVRWSYQVGSGAWAYSGWNIDDVELWGVPEAPPPVTLLGANSWKTHGTGGSAEEFSIDLPIAVPYPAPGLPGIETRSGGVTKLTFDFDRAITLPANPTDVARMYGAVHPGPYVPLSATLANGGTTLVTTWSGIPNADRYVVCLQIIGLLGDRDVEVIGQVGNVQLTPATTQAYTDAYDKTAIGPYLGQVATQSNCKFDIVQTPAPSAKVIDSFDKSTLAGTFSGPISATPSTCP